MSMTMRGEAQTIGKSWFIIPAQRKAITKSKRSGRVAVVVVDFEMLVLFWLLLMLVAMKAAASRRARAPLNYLTRRVLWLIIILDEKHYEHVASMRTESC